MKKQLLATLFGATLVLGACGGGDDANKDADKDAGGDDAVAFNIDDAPVSTGSCVSCHGGNLEGSGSNPSLQKVGAKYDQAEIEDIIINGTGGGMPGGMMSDEDAAKMAEWLAEQK